MERKPIPSYFKPLNAELNPICHLLALLGAHHILQGLKHVRILTLRIRNVAKRTSKMDYVCLLVTSQNNSRFEAVILNRMVISK